MNWQGVERQAVPMGCGTVRPKGGYLDVSENGGFYPPKSSILIDLIGFSIIFTIHFWGTFPYFLETPISIISGLKTSMASHQNCFSFLLVCLPVNEHSWLENPHLSWYCKYHQNAGLFVALLVDRKVIWFTNQNSERIVLLFLTLKWSGHLFGENFPYPNDPNTFWVGAWIKHVDVYIGINVLIGE